MSPPNPFDTPEQLNAILSTLSNRHSRAVCHYFRYYSTDSASVTELAQFVLELEGQDTDENSVKIHLHHATLPKLADAGIIDYDLRSETVRYREPEPVELWLDHIVEENEVLL